MVLCLPAPVAASLADETRITGPLMSAAIGDRIRKRCPSISARMVRVWREARGLKAEARRLGYSEAEIEAFLDDDAARDRIERAAEEWLAAQGAVKGRPESYCRVGRREIERGSLTGRLLRTD